ncbi:hypothetical protein POSPLADRAFT_1147040, partial [Postia placenta MAD-698-R-SB12]
RYSAGPCFLGVHLDVPPWLHTPTSKAHVSQQLWPVQNVCVRDAHPHDTTSRARLMQVESCGRCRMCASGKHTPTSKAQPFLHLFYGLPYGLPYGLSYGLP